MVRHKQDVAKDGSGQLRDEAASGTEQCRGAGTRRTGMAQAKVKMLPGLGWLRCRLEKKGQLQPKRGWHPRGAAISAPTSCAPTLPLCHGSRMQPAPLSLNFKLSLPASQQDTLLPRLPSHLLPCPSSSSPITPFVAWGCCPAAPCPNGQRRGAGAGMVPALQEGPWQREKEPPAATLFGDFAQIPVSLINCAPRQDPGTDPAGTAK